MTMEDNGWILFIAARIKAVVQDRGGIRAGLNLHAHLIGRLLFVSSFHFIRWHHWQLEANSHDSPVILVQTGFNLTT